MIKHATVLIAATLALVSGIGVAASEKKIQKKDLPPAVAKAMESKVDGQRVVGYALETDDGGKTFTYEMETEKDGLTRDVTFDPEGGLISVEQELRLDSAPEPVRTTVSSYGKVAKLESVLKDGKTTFEAHFHRGSKVNELKLTSDGKVFTEPK
jgi:hypothetical protein